MDIIYGKKSSYKRKDVIYLNENDLNLLYGSKAYELPISIINQIEKTKLDNKKVYQLFKYSNLSFWWFIYPTIFPAIKRAVSFIFNFQEMIRDKQPKIIQVVGELDKLDMIKQICSREKIELHYPRLKYFKMFVSKWLISKVRKYRFKKITLKKYKKRISLYKSKFDEIPAINGKIIFAVPTRYRSLVYRPEDDGIIKGEYIQGPIIDLIKKLNFEVVGMDLDYTFKGDVKTLSERLDESIRWFPVECILENYGKQVNYKNFLNLYNNIINRKDFGLLFNYQNINFWSQVKDEFIKLTYLPHLPSYIKLIESFSEFFSDNRPKSIFIPYETGPQALAIIIACRKYNVKTIGVQHGGLYENNPDYSHNEFQTESNSLGMPLPDHTLLFGNLVKKLLTEEGSYPHDKLVAFGNPEFFKLDEIINNLNSKDIKKIYKINPDKKVILFASNKIQNYYKVYGELNYDEYVWRHLLDNFAQDPKFSLVLKPHPDENTIVYEKILNEYKTKNAKIIQASLFEMIHVSSVVVTINSSVMLDSLVFKKPIIRVKFRNLQDLFNYEKYPVLLSTELVNLTKSIHEILDDRDLMNSLEASHVNFIKDLFNIPEEKPELILKKILFE